MRYVVQQKIISVGDSFEVIDKDKNVKYRAKGSLLYSNHELVLYDARDNVVGRIRRVPALMEQKFEMIMNNTILGTITKKVTVLGDKFEVDVNGWYVEGNITDWNYIIYDRDQEPIIHVNKKVISLQDIYIVDFAKLSDEFIGLMVIFAIDMASHPSKK